MTGNGNHTTYKNGDWLGILHIGPTVWIYFRVIFKRKCTARYDVKAQTDLNKSHENTSPFTQAATSQNYSNL